MGKGMWIVSDYRAWDILFPSLKGVRDALDSVPLAIF
jgi:hypothetical protein